MQAVASTSIDDVEVFLRSKSGQAEAAPLVSALCSACKDIALQVRTASCDSTACFNDFGDEQLAVDMLAEEALLGALESSGEHVLVSSMLEQALTIFGRNGAAVGEEAEAEAKFSVAIDSLDGVSIVDTNFAVGTLFSVWRAPSVLNVTGRDLVAAGACSYGPRTSLYLALADREDVHEFLLVGSEADGVAGRGRWARSNSFAGIGDGKLFAPGNLRAAASNPGYASLVKYWQDNRYQLRYTGGMVLDVLQLLIKGKGVFVTPASVGERPRHHLLYEAVPLAYLIEKCGGASSDGECSLLDVTVHSLDQRTQIAMGSASEVRRFDETIGPAPSPAA